MKTYRGREIETEQLDDGKWIACAQDAPVRAPELARRFAAQMPVRDQRSPLLGFSTRRWLARIVRHLHVRKLLWN
jgi:hypothetical protein